MVLLQGRQRRGLGVSHLALLLLASLRRGHYLAGSGLVGGMVEQSANVMDEKGIQQLRDFLFVRKVKCSFKGNPDVLVRYVWRHRGILRATEQTHQTPLRCMGPILTT